jgi:hypothetical protein
MWNQDTILIDCRNIIYQHINKNNRLYETKWSRNPIILSTVSVYPFEKNCLDSSAFLFTRLHKVVPYTSGKIWSACLIFLAVCLNISTVINIKMLANSNQQTQSYKFTSHIAAFLSVVLITEMLEICIQTSDDQNVQLILKSYLPLSYLAFQSFDFECTWWVLYKISTSFLF